MTHRWRRIAVRAVLTGGLLTIPALAVDVWTGSSVKDFYERKDTIATDCIKVTGNKKAVDDFMDDLVKGKSQVIDRYVGLVSDTRALRAAKTKQEQADAATAEGKKMKLTFSCFNTKNPLITFTAQNGDGRKIDLK